MAIPSPLQFSLLTIAIWILLVLSSLGIHFFAPSHVKPWAFWATGVLFVAVTLADIAWRWLDPQVQAKNLAEKITRNTKSHLDPSTFASTAIIGQIDEHKRELDEIQDLARADEVVAVVGPAGTGKSGLLCLLAERLSKSYVVLAIKVDPRLHTIHSAEELGSHQFGEPQNPATVLCHIRKLCRVRVCLVFDELDGIEETPLFGTIVSIIQLAQSHSICTVVAVRVEEGEKSNTLVELRKSIPNMRSVALQPFTEELARKYLIELGISQPSDSLIELSKNLRDLGIVAKLVEENLVVPSEPGRRKLWDAYIDEMDQKEDSGQGHVAEKAISLAKQMLREGILEIPLNADAYTRKLVSWGACVHFAAVNRIIFRYEELVYFLYAREAVSHRKRLQDIQDEVDEGFLYKVLMSVQQRALEVDRGYWLQLVQEIQQ